LALRILLVEDFADCATMTAAVLRHFGHTVQVVRDGPQALAACHGERPDAVLLDIGLPGMSGYDVAKQLRNELGTATPYLVALTGFGRPDDHQQSADAGIDRHLVKPVDLYELSAILGTLPKDNQRDGA
jgi:two-component system, chemotaxis family, CheB/CheR fusion protein